MTTWGAFRDRLRRSFLKDVDTGEPDWEFAWTDEQLLDAFVLAQPRFAEHTAFPKRTQWSAATEKSPGVYYDLSVDRTFVLPTDAFDDVGYSGRLVVLTENLTIPLLSSANAYYTDPYKASGTFRVFGNDLIVAADLEASNILELDYFAYYPDPTADASTLLIPRWAETAVSYLAAAHAMTVTSVRAAATGEFRSKGEPGVPEQNSWRSQQKWMLEMYEREVAKHPAQSRRIVRD